jgi:hypothetical protein
MKINNTREGVKVRLGLHPMSNGTKKIPNMKVASWLDTRKHPLFHFLSVDPLMKHPYPVSKVSRKFHVRFLIMIHPTHRNKAIQNPSQFKNSYRYVPSRY